MIRYFQIMNGKIIASDAKSAQVEVYINPDAMEKERIRSFCSVDDHTLLSALDPDEVPRVDIEDDFLFIAMKKPNNATTIDAMIEFQVSSIGMLLAGGRLLLITASDNISFEEQRYMLKIKTIYDVVLDMAYKIIQHYNEHLRVIRMLSKELQHKINESMENKHLIQMFGLSESLIYYLNAINSNNNVLLRLSSHSTRLGFSEDNKEVFEDLLIENNQCYKQAEIYSSVLSGLMDARGSIVNNNMNQLIKNLTIINIIFLPLNVIAGIGGMSEYSVVTEGIPKWVSYGLFTLGLVAIGWLTLIFLKRMNAPKKSQH